MYLAKLLMTFMTFEKTLQTRSWFRAKKGPLQNIDDTGNKRGSKVNVLLSWHCEQSQNRHSSFPLSLAHVVLQVSLTNLSLLLIAQRTQRSSRSNCRNVDVSLECPKACHISLKKFVNATNQAWVHSKCCTICAQSASYALASLFIN